MFERPYYLKLSELLRRLMRSLHVHTKRYFLSQKISFLEFQILIFLSSGKPSEMNKIKKELYVSGAFATNLVDRLVERKLVVRHRTEKDRRKVTVALTDKGRYYLAKLEKHRKRFLETLVNGLKEKDKKIMERGISILVDSLESMGSPHA